MKIRISIVSTLCLGSIAFGQGTLTPPGSPTPTMKTLDELDESITQISNAVENIEARIDLRTQTSNATAAEIVIYQPGSYYLTQNLIVNKDVGIYVNMDDVIIDLNGFTIKRSTSGGIGIEIPFNKSGVTVKNGTIRNFKTGINGKGTACSFEQLGFSECSSQGLAAGIAAQIKNCRAINNQGDGITALVGSSVEGCIAANNGGKGILIDNGSSAINCTARNNGSIGIQASSACTLRQCVATDNTSSGIKTSYGSTIIDCVANKNGSTGFSISAGCSIQNGVAMQNGGRGIYSVGSGCNLSSCLAQGNANDGIFLQSRSSTIDCLATDNKGSYGIYINGAAQISGCVAAYNESDSSNSSGLQVGSQSTVQDCVAWGNMSTYSPSGFFTGQGIQAETGSLVKNCSVSQNLGAGISASKGSQIVKNQCHYNGLYGANAPGIYLESGGGSRIADNLVTFNDYGIFITGSSTNLVFGNSASGNGADYSLTGTIIKGTSITNNGTISCKDSWANFEF